MKSLPLIVVIGLASLPLSLRADLVPDNFLGTLEVDTSTVLAGNTAGQPNNADCYINVSDPDARWGREIVWQFEVTETVTLELTLTAQSSGDIDFFLLDDVDTAPLYGKTFALDDLEYVPVDIPQGGSLPVNTFLEPIPAGTYYLVADHFDGFVIDGIEPSQGDAVFSATLTVYPLEDIDFLINLGPLTTVDTPFQLDTLGSDFDTELNVFDIDGIVVGSNNDAAGTAQSLIHFPIGLRRGRYYAVVSGYQTTFDTPLVGGVAGAMGEWRFRHSNGQNFAPETFVGTTTDTDPETGEPVAYLDTQYFTFTVVDDPFDLFGEAVVDLSPDPATPLVEGLAPFTLDTLGSLRLDEASMTFVDYDTELALYDSEGYLLVRNDDIPDPASTPENPLPGIAPQSQLTFDDGLLPGTYFLVLAGYNRLFFDGFLEGSDKLEFGDSLGGEAVLNFRLGSTLVSSTPVTVPTDEAVWFKFDVGPGPPEQIDFKSLIYDRLAQTFDMTWFSKTDKTYRVETTFGGTGLWVPFSIGLPNEGVETSYNATQLIDEVDYFFRVREDGTAFPEL